MNNLFDLNYLRKYVRAELSSQEMYEIERASHEDEMLADLIAGLEEEKFLNETFHKIDIDSAIYERTHPKNKIFSINYKWLGLAASIVLIIGSILYIYLPRQLEPSAAEAIIASAPQEEAISDSSLNDANADSAYADEIASSDIVQQKDIPSPQKGKVTSEPVEKTTEKKRIEELLAANLSPNKVPVNPDLWRKEEKIWLDEDLQGRVAGISVNKNTGTANLRIRGTNTYGAAPISKEVDNNANSSTIIVNFGKQNKSNVVGAIAPPKPSSTQGNVKFATGRVLDRSSGRPIINASIKDLQTNQVAVTDSTGQYILPINTANAEIEILSIGYEAQRIIASNNKIVQLSPSINEVDEVVVVGYSGKSAKFKSEPLVGWETYKKYLEENSNESLLGKGNVTLVFDINNFGRPIDIVIKKGESDALNQRAIRIIQNGPDWKKGNDGKKVEVKISFK